MLNNVSVIGRLTADPELRTTTTGANVTTFTLAVARDYVKKGEQRQTDFLDCVAWNNTADLICKYLHKGSQAALSGNLQTRNFEDRNGNKRKVTEINVTGVTFLDKRETTTETIPEAVPEIVANDEDLPFD